MLVPLAAVCSAAECCVAGGRYDTCTARTPRALLRRTHRAAASFLAVLRPHTAAVRPVLALPPRRLPLGCARGHCLSSPQSSREPQRYAPSSPLATSGFRVLRAAQHSCPLLRLPKGGTPHGTLSAQQSADRSTRPAAGLPPPHAGLPAALTPPWGSATSRRCALGSLLWPHPPRWGIRCAAGSARCTDYFGVSGQAEWSIVTP